MNDDSFINMCLAEVADGLRDGLCHFSPPSRTAVVYAVRPGDPPRIHDPNNLLRGHEPRLNELYLESDAWRWEADLARDVRFLDKIRDPLLQDQLSGLICCGGSSRSFYFQMWFTEHHPDMCSTGPTERWLEYAASLLSRNVDAGVSLNLGTSGYVLQEYSTHAVRDYIVDRRNVSIGWDTRLRVFPILDAVLGISKTLEEGAWPRGDLVFFEPSFIPHIRFQALFPVHERPDVRNYKHVRKMLLAVENSPRKLASDGRLLIGITRDEPSEACIHVEFRGSYGFLKLGEEPVCSFSDGRFNSSTRRPNLVQVEESLLETDLEPEDRDDLYRIITRIVQAAGEAKHGCTLVIDLAPRPRYISGQTLVEPSDLREEGLLDLAQSLSKVDGALHIGRDLRLHGFACLLDGRSVPGENRSRGARFNSALRFSAEQAEVIIVVVSADRPVSVIHGGVELTARCEWTPLAHSVAHPPILADWIEKG